jgi:hypothetical protein
MNNDTKARADILKARHAEMANHAFGRLARQPDHAAETFQALVARVNALGASVAGLDEQPAPAPPVAILPGSLAAGLRLDSDAPWRATGALVTRMLEVEARLAALDKLAAVAGPGVLEKMAVQVEVDGFVHRHPEAFHEALEVLVVRVLAAEARASALSKAKSKVPAS